MKAKVREAPLIQYKTAQTLPNPKFESNTNSEQKLPLQGNLWHKLTCVPVSFYPTLRQQYLTLRRRSPCLGCGSAGGPDPALAFLREKLAHRYQTDPNQPSAPHPIITQTVCGGPVCRSLSSAAVRPQPADGAGISRQNKVTSPQTNR